MATRGENHVGWAWFALAAVSSEVLQCRFENHRLFKNFEGYNIINRAEAPKTTIESSVVQPHKEARSSKRLEKEIAIGPSQLAKSLGVITSPEHATSSNYRSDRSKKKKDVETYKQDFEAI